LRANMVSVSSFSTGSCKTFGCFGAFAERVKIAENKVGNYAVFGAVFKACVGCNDIVAVVRRFAQSEKIACADYIAFMSVHGKSPIMNFAFIIDYNIIY
jgi:hypothetical protein